MLTSFSGDSWLWYGGAYWRCRVSFAVALGLRHVAWVAAWFPS